jgi:hypothetical protein
MITSFCLSLGAFFLVLLLTAAGESEVYINEVNGKNSPDCLPLLRSDGLKRQNACESLDFVASKIGIGSVGLTIVIETDLTLSGLVKFSNCTSLTITSKVQKGEVVLAASHSAKMACGLQFIGVINLTLSGVAVKRCEYQEELINMSRNVAILVHEVTDLTIRYLTVSHISGTGLMISDTGGRVAIENSDFVNNSLSAEDVSTNNVFAGGMHVHFGRSGVQGNIMIRDCIFANNHKPKEVLIDPVNRHLDSFQTLDGYGTGGGMGIFFMGGTEIDITLENCAFANNTANYGAGLYIHFLNNTMDSLTVSNSTFEMNSAKAGGGVCMGLAQLNGKRETFSRVRVINTTFSKNNAHYGGGTLVFAIHSRDFSEKRNDIVYFSRCLWEQNMASYSSAVDLSPFKQDHFNFGFLPVPTFSQCWFINNRLQYTSHSTKYRTSGIFAITDYGVQFEGTNHFLKNSYTALLLTSATVILKEGTVMIFKDNEGIRGAGIAMYGFSSLRGSDNCAMEFSNNSAKRVGGGIYYQPVDQGEIIGGRSCFLQYTGTVDDASDRNFTFTFQNNTALLGGTSIFAVSFFSCFYNYHGNPDRNNLTSFFSRIGTFQFDQSSISLATEGSRFLLEDGNISLTAKPGELIDIPLSVRDEFNQISGTPIGLEVHSASESGHQFENGASTFYYFTHNRTRLYGKPHEVKNLVFDTQNTRDAYFDKINVTFSDCPPGYYFLEGKNTCICSAEKKYTSYIGISKCNSSEYLAYISRQYWAGYVHGQLYTGPCAFKLCLINSNPSLHHLLPMNESEMNLMMCGVSKNGITCGLCVDHHSAYFHSDTHKCGLNSKCKWGVLFYALSELAPMVILFALIVHFNISFTSGGICGLVFFSQMILTTPTDMEKIMFRHSNSTIQLFKDLQHGYTLVYSILNLDFLSIDALSFCLWQSASPMAILGFKYLTTILALILVFVLVRIMNTRWYMRWNKNNKPRSVVHGLSAFLVLSYSQCMTVTFQILSHNTIEGIHNTTRIHLSVTYYGGLEYFGHKHLPFALTAIFFLIFIGIIPPLLLLLYPLSLQILSLCKLSEHHIARLFLKATHIHRLMPLFDSFQSCYKGKLRFFAGLYFLYKMSILFCRSYTMDLVRLMAGLESTIFIIFGIHAVVQPYRERSHNILDSLLIFNLGLINGINIYTNYITLYDVASSTGNMLIILNTLQMILIYVPIVSVFFWCVNKLFRRRRHREYQALDTVTAYSIQEEPADS